MCVCVGQKYEPRWYATRSEPLERWLTCSRCYGKLVFLHRLCNRSTQPGHPSLGRSIEYRWYESGCCCSGLSKAYWGTDIGIWQGPERFGRIVMLNFYHVRTQNVLGSPSVSENMILQMHRIFTALNGMQTRYSNENAVCVFVCQMHDLWQNDFYTEQRII